MKNTKMFEEDIIEEHNGVYGGKWHIVSPKGFDLPEGLEYMKNVKLCGDIIVSGMYLHEITEAFCALADKYYKENQKEMPWCSITVSNCLRKELESMTDFESVMNRISVINFKIKGCELTFADIRDIVNNSNNECYHEFDFSQNSFDRSVKNWEIFKEIAHPLYGYVYIKTLDLSHNGFSEQEQQKMRLLLGDPEWLVL